MPGPSSIAELVLARADDERPGLLTAQRSWRHCEVVAEAAARAAWLAEHRGDGPFHVAVLSDNSAEFVFWLQAAALAGATVVGANPTHRGDELVRDLVHTQCQLLVAGASHLALLEGRGLGSALGVVQRSNPRVFADDEAGEALAPYAGAVPPSLAASGVTPATLGYLLFTSGTSGAPKACRCSQGRLATIGGIVASMFALADDDVSYLAMPLFHSNALMAGWAPSLSAGAAVALPTAGRFSASTFLPDVRRFGATYFNYVGKPLAYILATPPHDDDRDNPLRRAFGNEGSSADVERFAARFGCEVTDGYGSSEGGANVSRTPDTPPGAMGRAPEGTCVLDPDTGTECPPAIFDGAGRLLNASEAIGELVSKAGGAGFEGYWRNEEAERVRVRNGWYWTGDLAYRDEAGFFYFAGRDHDWIRVDGENFATAPVERIVSRYPGTVVTAAYAVPDTIVGDQVMVAIEQGAEAAPFDGEDFARFLAAQGDLGTKWAPRYVRLCPELPKTATSKILKRELRAERWNTPDPLWWRPDPDAAYRLLTGAERSSLEAALAPGN